MGSWIGKLHDFTGSDKASPELRLTHWGLDGIHKASTKSVNMTSDGLGTTAEKWGWNSHFPRYWEGKSEKDYNNFGRWGENTLGGVGAVLGGMYGAGYLGAGEAGAAGGGAGGFGVGEAGGAAAGNGAFLGEGVGTGIAGWDGAAGGMGLGTAGGGTFNPNGLPQGSSYGSDIPGGNNGKIPGNITGFGSGNSSGMGLMGGGSQQQASGQRGGRQNLPLYENEKTDAQKLAELLQALEQQQRGY